MRKTAILFPGPLLSGIRRMAVFLGPDRQQRVDIVAEFAVCLCLAFFKLLENGEGECLRPVFIPRRAHVRFRAEAGRDGEIKPVDFALQVPRGLQPYAAVSRACDPIYPADLRFFLIAVFQFPFVWHVRHSFSVARRIFPACMSHIIPQNQGECNNQTADPRCAPGIGLYFGAVLV